MMFYKTGVLFCFMWNWYSTAGNTITITSNVTEVSIGDSYSVTCTSEYNRVDFYRNNRYIARPKRAHVGAPCMVNNTNFFNCNIIKHNKQFIHQLIILSAKQTGTTQWKCQYPTNNKFFSKTISITINGHSAGAAENVGGIDTSTVTSEIFSNTDQKQNNNKNRTTGDQVEIIADSNIISFAVIGAGCLFGLLFIGCFIYVVSRHRQQNTEPREKPESPEPVVEESNMYPSVNTMSMGGDYEAMDDLPLPAWSDDRCYTKQTADYDASKVYGVINKDTNRGTTTFHQEQQPCSLPDQQAIYSQVQRNPIVESQATPAAALTVEYAEINYATKKQHN